MKAQDARAATGKPAAFPFPLAPYGCPGQPYASLIAQNPLSRVILPSGDTAILAVRYDDVAMILSDGRFSRELFHPDSPRFFAGFDMSDAPDAMINMDPPRHT